MFRRFQFLSIKIFLLVAIVLGVASNPGCDHGLAPQIPVDTPSGVAGYLTFENWPPPDSVKDLRLFASPEYPIDNIIGAVLQGIVKTSGRLNPYGADTILFRFVLPVDTYKAFGVAQQFGPNALADWRVAAFYYSASDSTSPGHLVISPNRMVGPIHMHVDFQNPPPFP